MKNIIEFLKKNGFTGDFTDTMVEALAKEFSNKPDDVLELLNYSDGEEEMFLPVFQKLFSYNKNLIDEIIQKANPEVLPILIVYIDEEYYDRIIEKAKSDTKSLLQILLEINRLNPNYPIEQVAEEEMEKNKDNSKVLSMYLNRFPKERQTERMIQIFINGDGEFRLFPDNIFEYINPKYKEKYEKKFKQTKNIMYDWAEVEEQTPEQFVEVLHKIEQSEIKYPQIYDDLLSRTKVEAMDDKSIDLFFHLKFKNKDENEIEDIIAKYKYLLANNSAINKGIYLELLEKEYNYIPNNILVRISEKSTGQDSIQIRLADMKPNGAYRHLYEEILRKNNNAQIAYIGAILGNYHDNFQLLHALCECENDEQIDYNKLINILSSRNNYFGISSLDDVKKYEEIKRKICLRLLEKKGEGLYEVKEGTERKFAILELLYDIDYDSAENIIKKYAEDLDKLDIKNNDERYVVDLVKKMRSIVDMSEDEIDRLLSNGKFKEQILNEGNKNIINRLDIENSLIEMYSREYNELLFDANKQKSNRTISYNGKSINVYELPPNGVDTPFDFSMIVRVEGAYTNWEIPENYENYYNQPSIQFHGVCESYINQSMLAIARTGAGPIVGYGSPCMFEIMGPWDLDSNMFNWKLNIREANWVEEARTAISKFPLGGIQYRTPKEMIDNTRHPHNELVSDRLIYDSNTNTLTRKIPSYVLMFKERTREDFSRFEDENFNKLSEEERKKLETEKTRYDESKRLAIELNIPIVIIDREAFAIQEKSKVIENLKILKGEKDNTTNKTKQELIRETILLFENNRNGLRYTNELKNEYFTDDDRKKMISAIMSSIELNSTDNNERLKNLEFLKKTLEEESNKRNTISGRFVDAEPYPKIYEEIKHKIEEIMRMEEKYSSNLSKSDKKKAIIKAIEESGITGENINKAEQMLGVEDKENKITHADSE